MLFNSYIFVGVFLPVTLVLVRAFAAVSSRFSLTVLTVASLVFYAWWSVADLPLLLGSVAFNYLVGSQISRAVGSRRRMACLTFGVAVDLAILAYFKYAIFFGELVLRASGFDAGLHGIVLPVGISFFTFTQIAYLVDAARRTASEYDPVRFTLFVTFFPHLIAGPILHHRPMIAQFSERNILQFKPADIAAGLTLFTIGLFKKVVFADSIAPVANSVFQFSDPASLTFAEAWVGTLSYTMQIYFDFSGYSDMALGLARMLGLRLPLNFNSPYQSKSVIDFWKRWHMSLSQFLRDYLYIPLGGSRCGSFRRGFNLFVTMMLGGFWHGASLTFLVWGMLHGFLLIINHLWRTISIQNRRFGIDVFCWFVTFIVINFTWVIFRADDLSIAASILSSMLGLKGVALPGFASALLEKLSIDHAVGNSFANGLFDVRMALPLLLVLMLISVTLPNSQMIMARFSPVLDEVKSYSWGWCPSLSWAIVMAFAFAISITKIGGESPFLYFRF